MDEACVCRPAHTRRPAACGGVVSLLASVAQAWAEAWRDTAHNASRPGRDGAASAAARAHARSARAAAMTGVLQPEPLAQA